MKQCPKCAFTFPDFHHVCDFDGAELLPDPEHPDFVPARPSRVRRWLKSRLFLTSLAATGLLTSALVIGYFDSVSESARAAKDQPATDSLRAMSNGPVSDQLPAVSQKPGTTKGSKVATSDKSARTSFAHLKRPSAAMRSVARVPRRTFTTNPPRRSETVQERDARPISEPQQQLQPQQVSRQEQVAAQPPTSAQPMLRPQPIAHDKEPKLTAMLKTTWRMLKRPFKF